MHLLWALIIGLVIGVLAKLVMPGKDPGGIIVTSLLGIGGAIVASLIGQAAGWYAPGQDAGIIASIIGAVLILAGYRMLAGRRVP